MSKEKIFNLQEYIQSDDTETIIYKEPEYVVMPSCIQKAIGSKGFLLGHMTMLYGLSDSGKTNVMLHAAKECQLQGNLPILVVTENKLNKKRASDIGLDLQNCIIKEDLTTLEDVYDYISMKIHDVKNGKLPFNTMIFWDSVASTPSRESFEIGPDGKIKKKYGPQKNAAVIGYYNPIIMRLVTSTRQIDCKHSVGVFLLNQAYIKPPEFSGGMASVVANGGEKIWYPLSMTIEIKEGKRLKATVKGSEIEYGMISKLRVKKYHDGELNHSGEVVFAGTELFDNDETLIKEHKKNNKEHWEELISELGVEDLELLSRNGVDNED